MVNIQDYAKQLLIAKTAKKELEEFKNENPDAYEKFIEWFHLRPGSNKVTIVTTHHDRPMRGIYIGRTKVKSAAEFLAGCITDNKTIDWDKIANTYNSGKGFAAGGGSNGKINGNKEYPHQANMINDLHDNKKLKNLLGVKNLYFVASEVVFSRRNEKRKKIDVVAHDGEGKVFFFEMKAPDNKLDNPVKQVKEYLEMYGKKGEKNKIFEEMLKCYPQNPIAKINEYVGYGIIGYSENPVLDKNEKMLIHCT